MSLPYHYALKAEVFQNKSGEKKTDYIKYRDFKFFRNPDTHLCALYNLHHKISKIDHHLNPNEKMFALVEAIVVVLGEFCPEKIKKKQRFGKLDWDNRKIHEEIKKREKLRQKTDRKKSNADLKAFSKAMCQFNLLIRRNKRNY